MSEKEALRWISVYIIVWYSAGAGIVLYLGHKFILKLQDVNSILMLWTIYLGMSRPIQLWLFIHDPFKDDLGHLWFLAIDITALTMALVLATKSKCYNAVIIELGVIVVGLATTFVGARWDLFGLFRFVH